MKVRTVAHRALFALASLLAGVLLAAPALAQQFPTKAITLICPWPVGGSSDLVLRSFAEAAGKQLGQPVVIENKPGASGTMGAAALVAARPDGYVLTQAPITVFRLPHLQKVAFDPLKDLTYVIGLTGYTFGVVVRADAPWKTFKEFLDYAKANPGKVSYGTPGAGTSLHITMEEIAANLGIKFLHIPYKGVAENIQGLLGGHIDATVDSTGWAPQVDSGRARLLVTWGTERTKRWPAVPTLKELGYGIVSVSPFGIAGPKGMDPAVVKTLHDAFRRAMDDPNYLKTLDRYDQPTIYMSGEEYTAFARKQFEADRVMMEKLGLRSPN
ncbi:MAG: tripartite tricarboxylate transporter substrate binding protein [Proteobacteria bacterium]|nr:tripartite tricarboxylate transporter substrate binding protein [Pseudomonadota bacterium]